MNKQKKSNTTSEVRKRVCRFEETLQIMKEITHKVEPAKVHKEMFNFLSTYSFEAFKKRKSLDEVIGSLSQDGLDITERTYRLANKIFLHNSEEAEIHPTTILSSTLNLLTPVEGVKESVNLMNLISNMISYDSYSSNKDYTVMPEVMATIFSSITKDYKKALKNTLSHVKDQESIDLNIARMSKEYTEDIKAYLSEAHKIIVLASSHISKELLIDKLYKNSKFHFKKTSINQYDLSITRLNQIAREKDDDKIFQEEHGLVVGMQIIDDHENSYITIYTKKQNSDVLNKITVNPEEKMMGFTVKLLAQQAIKSKLNKCYGHDELLKPTEESVKNLSQYTQHSK
ncbi:MAG: hypothetical protein KKF65_07425 [Nanoarchaeota archaeon]|nr:hypothetical protein [Nanoarchaeota archaeon]